MQKRITIHTVKCNEHEVQYLSGRKATAAKELLEQFGIDCVVTKQSQTVNVTIPE